MLVVFIIELVNLRTHFQKEVLKLDLKKLYSGGKKMNRRYILEVAMLVGGAICELILTQLNLLDLYTDFSFLTICYV